MKSNCTITVALRKDKKRADGTCPIYYFIGVAMDRLKIPSGKYVNPNDWNDKQHSPKKSCPNGLALSRFLVNKTNDFNRYILEKETQGQIITANKVKAFFNNKADITLYQFWAEQIERWRHKRANNTIKGYKSSLNILKNFSPKLDFGDLSLQLIEDFDCYLATERGNKVGGRFGIHKDFRAIIYDAMRKGYINNNPYRLYKIESAEGHREYLTIDEVITIMDYEIPEGMEHLYKIKGMFLVSCFTGLRYSDIVKLKTTDFKRDGVIPRLEITVQKTDRPLIIPLNTYALNIIEPLLKTVRPNDLIFSYITNQALNRSLKQLIEGTEVNKTITFHCARHTFACNHIENNTSIMRLKDLMGHRDVKHTQIYAKTLQKDLYESVNSLDLFYQKRKQA